MNTRALAIKPASFLMVFMIAIFAGAAWMLLASLLGENLTMISILVSIVLNWSMLNFPKMPFHSYVLKSYRDVAAKADVYLHFAMVVIGMAALIGGMLQGYGVFYGALVVMFIVGEVINFNRATSEIGYGAGEEGVTSNVGTRANQATRVAVADPQPGAM